MKIQALALSILLVAGFALASDSEGEITMEDTQWQLVLYLDDTGEMASVLPDITVDIKFSEGKLSGSAGCNRYFGGYDLAEDDQIRFTSQMGSTQMACAPQINSLEQLYLALLPQTASWKLEEGHLTLFDYAGAALLKFAAVEPIALEDTAWQAIGINNGKGGVVSTASTSLSTATFSDGTVSGSGGCNRFNAAYEIESDHIRIGPTAATRKFCPEPEGLMDQEQQFFAALERARTLQVTPGKLELRDEKSSLQISFRIPSQ